MFNGETISDLIINNLTIQNFIPSVDIGFTLTSRMQNDNDNNYERNSISYSQKTNKHESIELMSRISYLINEFIEIVPKIKIYVIGRNTKDFKLMIYKKMFNNLFGDKFIMVEGQSIGYEEGAMYFINKNILK